MFLLIFCLCYGFTTSSSTSEKGLGRDDVFYVSNDQVWADLSRNVIIIYL